MKKQTFEGWVVVSNDGDLQFTETEPFIFSTKKRAMECIDSPWQGLDKVERVTITVKPIKRKKRVK
jgi:hypothetical protein